MTPPRGNPFSYSKHVDILVQGLHYIHVVTLCTHLEVETGDVGVTVLEVLWIQAYTYITHTVQMGSTHMQTEAIYTRTSCVMASACTDASESSSADTSTVSLSGGQTTHYYSSTHTTSDLLNF